MIGHGGMCRVDKWSSGSGLRSLSRVSLNADEKLHQLRDRILRVDHAGEYGANRIYAGQMAVLGKSIQFILLYFLVFAFCLVLVCYLQSFIIKYFYSESFR